MYCIFCKDECQSSELSTLIHYAIPEVTSFLEVANNFVIKKDNRNNFVSISLYNNDILLSKLDFDGCIERYFNANHVEIIFSSIHYAFIILEDSCRSHEFISSHNISFEEEE